MSKTKIIQAKGGKAEKSVEIQDIVVPDLWHVSQYLKKAGKENEDPWCTEAGAAVLKTWHLAHDLRRHIEEADAKAQEAPQRMPPSWPLPRTMTERSRKQEIARLKAERFRLQVVIEVLEMEGIR